jgi:glycosyltransferase involved in cell wall biosynthesis
MNERKIDGASMFRFWMLFVRCLFLGTKQFEKAEGILWGGHGWILDKICREIHKARSLSQGQPVLIATEELFYIIALRSIVLGDFSKKFHLYFTHPKKIFLPKFLRKFLLRRVEIVFIQSLAHKSYLDTFLSCNCKFVETWGGVGKEEVKLAYDSKFVESKRPQFITIGRYYKRKNSEILAMCAKTHPEVDFLIIGERWPKSITDRPNVRSINRVDSVYPYIMASNALIAPGSIEGGPYPLLEAAVCGVPVIAYRTGIVESPNWNYEATYRFNTAAELIDFVGKLKHSRVRCEPYDIDDWGRFSQRFVIDYDN